MAASIQRSLESVGAMADPVRIKVNKPNALPSGIASVEVVRGAEQCRSPMSQIILEVADSKPSLAVLSVGSNIQPRFQHIDRALRLLERDPCAVRIVDSSFMYDTTPMYVENQHRFANCALLVSSFILVIS